VTPCYGGTLEGPSLLPSDPATAERQRGRPLWVVLVGQCSSWCDDSISERFTGAMRSSKKKADIDARTRWTGVI
jgi:hypothetical protein